MEIDVVYEELVVLLYRSEEERTRMGVSGVASDRATASVENAETRREQAWDTEYHHQVKLLLSRYKRRLDALTASQLRLMPCPPKEPIEDLSDEAREVLRYRIQRGRKAMWTKYGGFPVDLDSHLSVSHGKSWAVAECIGFLLAD